MVQRSGFDVETSGVSLTFEVSSSQGPKTLPEETLNLTSKKSQCTFHVSVAATARSRVVTGVA